MIEIMNIKWAHCSEEFQLIIVRETNTNLSLRLGEYSV